MWFRSDEFMIILKAAIQQRICKHPEYPSSFLYIIKIWWYFFVFIIQSIWTSSPTSLAEMQPQTMAESSTRFGDGCCTSSVHTDDLNCKFQVFAVVFPLKDKAFCSSALDSVLHLPLFLFSSTLIQFTHFLRIHYTPCWHRPNFWESPCWYKKYYFVLSNGVIFGIYCRFN